MKTTYLTREMLLWEWRGLTVEQRFWDKVERDSRDHCWIWNGHRQRGYGRLHIHKKLFLAPRVSWVLHYGDIPEGKLVLHSCDNPPCVNPLHLFLGTPLTNAEDRGAKGRHSYKSRNKGEDHPRAILTNRTVSEIRARHVVKQYGILKQLAQEFGVSKGTIKAVVSGRRWR